MEARRLWNNTFIMPNDSKTLSLELYTSKNTFQDKHDEAISEKQKKANILKGGKKKSPSHNTKTLAIVKSWDCHQELGAPPPVILGEVSQRKAPASFSCPV